MLSINTTFLFVLKIKPSNRFDYSIIKPLIFGDRIIKIMPSK